MARYILSILLFVFALTVNAQNDRQLIREGNRMFNKQQYDKAEIQYRKAVSKILQTRKPYIILVVP